MSIAVQKKIDSRTAASTSVTESTDYKRLAQDVRDRSGAMGLYLHDLSTNTEIESWFRPVPDRLPDLIRQSGEAYTALNSILEVLDLFADAVEKAEVGTNGVKIQLPKPRMSELLTENFGTSIAKINESIDSLGRYINELAPLIRTLAVNATKNEKNRIKEIPTFLNNGLTALKELLKDRPWNQES